MIVDVRIIKYLFIVIFSFKSVYMEYDRTQGPGSKNPVCYHLHNSYICIHQGT